MKKVLFLLQKEFRQILRDKMMLGIIFLLPLVELSLLPPAMDFDIKNINLCIVDHDHSPYSARLVSDITSSGYFKVVSNEETFIEAIKKIESEKSDIVLEIPANFQRNLLRNNAEKVGISVDAINITKSGIGGAYLQNIILSFSSQIEINSKTLAVMQTPQMPRLSITSTNLFNPNANFYMSMLPTLLVLLVTMVAGFVSALNIVQEKEMGTIEQINVTPIKKWEFILGKLIPFWIMGLIIFTLGLLVSWLQYGFPPRGSIALLYLLTMIFLIAMLGLGLFISTISENQIQAVFIAFFFIVIFMMMGGFFTAVESMPGWAQVVANLMPVTYYLDAIRMVMVKGSGWQDVYKQFFYLIIFAIALNVFAVGNYRKTN